MGERGRGKMTWPEHQPMDYPHRLVNMSPIFYASRPVQFTPLSRREACGSAHCDDQDGVVDIDNLAQGRERSVEKFIATFSREWNNDISLGYTGQSESQKWYEHMSIKVS